MCIFPQWYRTTARAALALVIGLAVVPCAALADDFQEASQLFKEGQYELALARVNKAIAARPKDPEARFLKGLILTEQGNSEEAVEVFQRLTLDYPALPEPYNNLAVIYASRGENERARMALEKSIHTHPSYATAYENLGDVYARLASQAYDKALQLDSRNAGAQGKLALVRELVGGAPRSAPQDVVTAAPAPAAAPQPQAGVPQQTVVATEPPASAQPANAPKPVAREVKVASATSAPRPASTGSAADIEGEVKAALNGWARAWSRKDADAYLAYYAEDFVPPRGESRPQWESTRRERIAAPKSISVTLSAVRVAPSGAMRATATFRQQYQSDKFTGSSRKTIVLVRHDGRWRIAQESVK